MVVKNTEKVMSLFDVVTNDMLCAYYDKFKDYLVGMSKSMEDARK